MDGNSLRRCPLEEALGFDRDCQTGETAEHLWLWKLFVRQAIEGQRLKLAQDLSGSIIRK